MIGGRLISQGSYGCVFVPPLKCTNNDIPEKGIISKVQENDEYAEMETKIGALLKNDIHFAPIEKQCEVNLKFDRLRSINKGQDLESCNVITDKKKEYVVLKSDYIKGGELRPFILKQRTARVKKMLKCFKYILEGIKILHSKGVIHHDLKSGNILMDVVSGNPKIIDFGMSFQENAYTKDKTNTIRRSFVKYAPEYVQYPPEVHMISALFFLTDRNKQNAIHRVAVDNTNELNKTFKGIFKDDAEYESYRQKLQTTFYSDMKGQTDAVKIYDKLFETWKTWDVYAVVVDMYITVLDILKSVGDKKKTKAIEVKNMCEEYIKKKRISVDQLIVNIDKINDLA